MIPFRVCLLAALALSASAEPVDMLFQNWNSRDGLPQDHIRAIVRTRDGLLWLGTDAGLARFDGNEFKSYGLREGLDAVAVMSLMEADDGTLWVSTLGGGVTMLRDGRIVKTYPRMENTSPSENLMLGQDAEGRMWAGGTFRLEGERFVAVPGGRGFVREILRDRQGVMWMNHHDDRIRRWQEGGWQDGSGGGPALADTIHEDAQGRLWAAERGRKLWCRDTGGWKSWPLPDTMKNRVNSMSFAPDGTLWMAFFREGLVGFRDGKFIEPRMDGERFLDLSEIVYAAPDGLLWLGSSANGLYSLVPRRLTLATINDPAANRGANFIGALLESAPGEFMVGSQGHGLFGWKDGISGPVAEMEALNRGLYVNSLWRDRSGAVWAGSGVGMHRLTGAPQGPPSRLVSGNVWEIRDGANGSLWVGRGNGELHHVPKGGKPVKIDYDNDDGAPIKGMDLGPDGALWIGTRGSGLFRLKDGKPKRFRMADGLGSEVIRVVDAEDDGTLWVGTAGGGLSILRDDRFLTVTTADGLPDDIVSQIAEDKTGRLWVGTNRGIAVIAKDEVARLKEGRLTELHPLVINRADGLVSEECTIVPPVAMSDGRMAFATTHGFAMLKPEEFQSDEATPPVFIEQVRANGRPVVPIDGKLELPPGLDRLEIEFSGLYFAAPSRLRFRNRLGGVEEEWGTPGAERRVEYRNLAPGDYRFELAGSIGNGVWTPQPAMLDITLAPHFWQTAWFKILAGLLSLGLVAATARTIERARARRKIEELKREQAVQTERARIARDLHDDVGASLTQVALLSELADSDLDAEPELARGHINEIFTTAKEVTRSLDEIVWAVNPAQDTLERFAAFLGTFVQNYARTAGLNGRLDIPGDLPDLSLTSAIRHHLYLATKEALHNIVKHAGATEIRLRLIPGAKELKLVIEDNGRGLADSDRGEGDGLDNLRKRLDQIGGTCTHRSAPGQGTTVEMLAPLA
ncbi:histidine kinase [Luteolibacter arcticus]|uniref:Oxygen sensor histidine kinase NreB n=1 Tax=Luteolibacter arcticus TaxID=1581411 RepID=A0ABT3GD61_9BACT|nr:sensor histidine kinase [Luteolibacter arcticus]MCW1921198.1 histidine kinase [Luteolibacter arcticus]